MANVCSNNLVIEGDQKRIIDFFDGLMTETQDKNNEYVNYSFSTYAPVGTIQSKVSAWGTRSDIDGNMEEAHGEALMHATNKVCLDIATSWNPPSAWLEKVAEIYPELIFKLWYEETGMGLFGCFTFSEGELESEDTFNTEQEMAYERSGSIDEVYDTLEYLIDDLKWSIDFNNPELVNELVDEFASSILDKICFLNTEDVKKISIKIFDDILNKHKIEDQKEMIKCAIQASAHAKDMMGHVAE